MKYNEGILILVRYWKRESIQGSLFATLRRIRKTITFDFLPLLLGTFIDKLAFSCLDWQKICKQCFSNRLRLAIINYSCIDSLTYVHFWKIKIPILTFELKSTIFCGSPIERLLAYGTRYFLFLKTNLMIPLIIKRCNIEWKNRTLIWTVYQNSRFDFETVLK